MKLPEIRSAISTATAAEMPGSRIVRPADLSPTMKPPMAKARKLSTAASTICPPAQRDILGAGDAFKLRSKKKPQGQAGDKVKHDHHDHADADPLPVQGSGDFLLLLVTLVGAATFSAAATAPDLTHTRTPGVGPDSRVAGQVPAFPPGCPLLTT